jgi:hypothetical protein
MFNFLLIKRNCFNLLDQVDILGKSTQATGMLYGFYLHKTYANQV